MADSFSCPMCSTSVWKLEIGVDKIVAFCGGCRFSVTFPKMLGTFAAAQHATKRVEQSKCKHIIRTPDDVCRDCGLDCLAMLARAGMIHVKR